MDRKFSRSVPPGCCRVGPLCCAPDLLAEFGQDAGAVLSRAGIAPETFDHPEGSLGYRDAGRLLAQCVAATGCGHFGLLVGQRCSLATLGLIGRLAGTAPDVRTGLRELEHYLPVFDRGCTISLRTEDQSAVLSAGIAVTGIESVDQVYDLILAVSFNTLRELCGACWSPTLVTLPHRAPADAKPFSRFFRTDIRFDAPEAAIWFNSFWLDRSVAGALSAARPRLLSGAEAVRGMLDMTTGERVRRELRAALPARWLTEEEIASRLSMDASTLRRRLAREGSRFRGILDELRMETARHFLTTSELDCGDISLLLGYSEASAFARAFRRWSGRPPSAWRSHGTVAPAQ